MSVYRTRRRRHEYTPAQQAATNELHRAEMWLNIVSNGISETLKHERYCGLGMRQIIGFVNKDLEAAVEDLEAATKAHDAAFDRAGRGRIAVVVTRKQRKTKRTKKVS